MEDLRLNDNILGDDSKNKVTGRKVRFSQDMPAKLE
jgi:hypothetical protein